MLSRRRSCLVTVIGGFVVGLPACSLFVGTDGLSEASAPHDASVDDGGDVSEHFDTSDPDTRPSDASTDAGVDGVMFVGMQVTSATQSSTTVFAPPESEVGDLLVAVYRVGGCGPPTPAAWSQIGKGVVSNVSGSNSIWVGSHVVHDGESGSSTWDFEFGNCPLPGTVLVAAFRNARIDQPVIGVVSEVVAGCDGGAGIDGPSIGGPAEALPVFVLAMMSTQLATPALPDAATEASVKGLTIYASAPLAQNQSIPGPHWDFSGQCNNHFVTASLALAHAPR